MRKLSIIISFILLVLAIPQGCQKKQNPRFSWLVGNWQLVDENAVSKTLEVWSFKDEVYHGHGFVLLEGDTVWQEHMVLEETNGKWSLQVTNPEHKESVSFEMIAQTDTSFSVQNLENEFPKIIKYWKGKNTLYAEISNTEKKVPFLFKPTKN